MKYHIIVNSGSGDQYLLSLKGSFRRKDWNDLEELLSNTDEDWEDVIKEYYKGRKDFLGVWDFHSYKCPIEIYSMGNL